MSIFERLISLYANSSRTPLEDFTTEILTGILGSNQKILETFVEEILKIKGKDFVVESQEYYSLPNDNCRVDMVFENLEIICFLENKVESGEGYGQLQKYSKLLFEKNSKETYLRYCSKYYDKKELTDHHFLQFRWTDVADFLTQFQDNPQIADFIQFLRSYGMGDKKNFTTTELVAMENIVPLISKLDEYLDFIKPKFYKFFGESNVKQSHSIKNNHSYDFSKGSVCSGDGWVEIGTGFHFQPIPSIYVWVWTNKKYKNYDRFNQLFLEKDYIKNETGFSHEDGYFDFSKPVSDFLSSKKMYEVIEKWYISKFEIIKRFIKDTPELKWNREVSKS